MRKQATKSNDKARIMRSKLDQTPQNLWESMRKRYPEETRAMVDAAARGLTIADLIQLEVAEHERLAGQIRAAEATLADLRSRRAALEEQAGANRAEDPY